MENPEFAKIADMICVRRNGDWINGVVVAVSGRVFKVRFFDGRADVELRNTKFLTVEQKGWFLHKTPKTCNG